MGKSCSQSDDEDNVFKKILTPWKFFNKSPDDKRAETIHDLSFLVHDLRLSKPLTLKVCPKLYLYTNNPNRMKEIIVNVLRAL